MNKKELAGLAPELLEALEALFKEYCQQMASEYDFSRGDWTPERDYDTVPLKAKALIEKARST
jgi:hypothetical protein